MSIIEQEPDRVPPRLVRRAALVLGVMIAGSVGATELLGPNELGETDRLQDWRAAQIEIAPFQVRGAPEIAARRAALTLQQYGWVDRSRGLIHVPLDVAIEIYLAEPAR